MSAGHGHVDASNKTVALLAISERSGKNAQTHGLPSPIDASNLWSFLEARPPRR